MIVKLISAKTTTPPLPQVQQKSEEASKTTKMTYHV